MKNLNQKKCYECGSFENLMIQYKSKVTANITYVCRSCNTKRVKNYRHRNKERVNEIIYKSMRKYPEKVKCRRFLNRAVKEGKINKPDSCSACSLKSKVDAHHYNYKYPYCVVWLCRSCHIKLHKKLKLVNGDVHSSLPTPGPWTKVS